MFREMHAADFDPDPAFRRCPTDKVPYHTVRDARQAARRLTGEFGYQIFYYRCTECPLFHTTKKATWPGRAMGSHRSRR